MKNTCRTLMCLGTLIAGVAVAQNDPSTQPGRSGREGGYHHAGMKGFGQDLRASKINGAQVKSSTGENLGTIEDIIFNSRGRAEFAAITLSNPSGTTPTGAGEKLTLIPWKLLQPSTTGGGGLTGEQQYTFTANVDQTKLASAPSFDKNQWPDMSRRDWSQQYYSYFGMTPDSTGGTGTGMEHEKGSGTDKEGSSTDKGAGAGGLQPKSGTY